LNIVHINTHGLAGGASIVALNLIEQQRLNNHHVSYLFTYGDKGVTGAQKIPFDFDSRSLLRAQEFVIRKVSRIEARLGLQYCTMPPAFLLKRLDVIKSADIVHFHNTHGGYLNLWAVSAISRMKPVVWTLHDEWAYTGHCATTLGCERWKAGCGECPHLSVNPDIRLDTTRMIFRFKASSYRKGRFVLTCPSHWLVERVGDSMLACRERRYIPNGVDTNTFNPDRKISARSRLGLPADALVVMFAAHFGTRNPLKGFSDFCRAIEGLNDGERASVCLVGVGNSGESIPLPVRTHWTGRIDDTAIMADYYAAADVFVLPSYAENSPLTIIESMACGTGVLAYDVGGVAELVSHKLNGYVARYRDIADLTSGLRWFLSLSESGKKDLSDLCVDKTRGDHDMTDVNKQYEELYNDLLCAK